MQVIEWLTNPALRSLLLPGLLAGVAVVLAGSILSVLVVLRRLAFVGQGVSHSAFGGIGVAAILGALSAQAAARPAWIGAVARTLHVGDDAAAWAIALLIVVAFCIAAAIGMAVVSDRRTVQEDTAIGVFLVASMSLGAVLLSISVRTQRLGGAAGYESILFGQIMAIGPVDAAAAAIASALTLGVLWWIRRPLLLWAFDQTAAEALGVRARGLRLALMVLLAVAIVTAMKLVGVVLATALLMLPGATALKLSDRLGRVCVLACLTGLAGLAIGVVLSLELDLPTGATIVLALTALFGAAWVRGAIAGRATPRPTST